MESEKLGAALASRPLSCVELALGRGDGWRPQLELCVSPRHHPRRHKVPASARADSPVACPTSPDIPSRSRIYEENRHSPHPCRCGRRLLQGAAGNATITIAESESVA